MACPTPKELKLEAERGLQQARIADHVADFPEALGVRQTEARVAEVDVVEQVVGFRAEQNPLAFRDREALYQRGVHVEEARSAEGAASGVAVVRHPGIREL